MMYVGELYLKPWIKTKNYSSFQSLYSTYKYQQLVYICLTIYVVGEGDFLHMNIKHESYFERISHSSIWLKSMRIKT